MLIIVSLIAAILFSLIFCKPLRKHPVPFYILALALCCIFGLLQPERFPDWVNAYLGPMFRKGTLGTGIFAVVMFLGAMGKDSKLRKYLMPVRGRLSILASIIIFSHVVFYLPVYLPKLYRPGSMDTEKTIATVLSIVMLAIMLPLFITSFRIIRRKIKGVEWKKLQRWAYLFYALIYVHVFMLLLPHVRTGNKENMISLIVYSILFALYAIMRIGRSGMPLFGKVPLYILAALLSAAAVSCTAVSYRMGLTEFMEDVQEDETRSEEVKEAHETESSEAPESDDGRQQMNESHEGGMEDAEESVQTNPASEQNASSAATAVSGDYIDGTYEGVGPGYNNKIKVQVTIEAGLITGIEILSHSEDEPYFSDALALVQDVLDQQTYNVDTVSGATTSSKGLITAIRKAVKKAIPE